jgi:hypothetical protein
MPDGSPFALLVPAGAGVDLVVEHVDRAPARSNHGYARVSGQPF